MRDLLDDPTFAREVSDDAERRRRSAERNSEFRQKLEHLISECSMENYSDTRDFVLAAYLSRCLAAYEEAVISRDKLIVGEELGETRDKR